LAVGRWQGSGAAEGKSKGKMQKSKGKSEKRRVVPILPFSKAHNPKHQMATIDYKIKSVTDSCDSDD
jgi:hypothetical protein